MSLCNYTSAFVDNMLRHNYIIIPLSDYEQASCYHAGPCLCKYSTKTFFGLVKTFCHKNLLAVRLCFISVNFPTQPSDSIIYDIDSWLLG